MADGKRKWFKGEFSAGNSIKTPGGGDKINLDDNGYHKTDGLSLTAIEVADKRFEKGFTPNEAYSVENKGLAPNGWYGDLLNPLLILKVLIMERQYMEHQDIVKEILYYYLMMV